MSELVKKMTECVESAMMLDGEISKYNSPSVSRGCTLSLRHLSSRGSYSKEPQNKK